MRSPTDRFTAVYRASYDDLLRYVRRRVEHGAEDVVAEAMTTAWRRVEELPDELDTARAWLFGIARNTLLNHRRGQDRFAALGVRLADHGQRVAPDGADDAAARVDMLRAWAQLTADEQDVIALTTLDGLTSEQAGAVLGISAAAYRHRLSRARATLRTHLAPAPATFVKEPTC